MKILFTRIIFSTSVLILSQVHYYFENAMSISYYLLKCFVKHKIIQIYHIFFMFEQHFGSDFNINYFSAGLNASLSCLLDHEGGQFKYTYVPSSQNNSFKS